MRVSTAYRFIGAIVAVSAMAACASGESSSVPLGSQQTVGTRTQLRYDSHCPNSVVYVDAPANQAIEIYDRLNLPAGPCGKITGLLSPQGLFVDSKANLWVADASSRSVYEFKPGQNAPVRQLSDPNGEPYAVALGERSGTVYVSEYSNDFDASTLVEIYAKGSTSPTGSLRDPAAAHGGYVAVDNAGNVYGTFQNQANKGQVDRWNGGTGTPENLGFSLVSGGGIATTADGSLAVCDPFAFRCGIFASGATKMAHVFGHMGRKDGGIVPNKLPLIMPQALALSHSQRIAYVVSNSLTNWRYPGPLDRPNHLPIVQVKIPGGGGQGIAVSPASPPGAPY